MAILRVTHCFRFEHAEGKVYFCLTGATSILDIKAAWEKRWSLLETTFALNFRPRCRMWFGCGSDVVQTWFGRGSDVVQTWFGRGSDVFSDLVQTVWQKLRESGFQQWSPTTPTHSAQSGSWRRSDKRSSQEEGGRALKKGGRALKKRGRVLKKVGLVRGTGGGPLLQKEGGGFLRRGGLLKNPVEVLREFDPLPPTLSVSP